MYAGRYARYEGRNEARTYRNSSLTRVSDAEIVLGLRSVLDI